MPPPKKAAKKTAKKASKKAANPLHDKHRNAKDLRRAFEHMGRLEILRESLQSSAAEALSALTAAAQAEIKSGENRNAAGLLRAAEHLSFAILAGTGQASGRISVELEEAINEQFSELAQKADEHWAEHKQDTAGLSTLYENSRKNATEAFRKGAYHQALEFARAAEALAQIKKGPHRLKPGVQDLRLEAS